MKTFKTRQTFLLLILILSVLLITGCGGPGGGGNWDEPVPINPVSATVPVNGATGVPIGNKLTVTFTEAMDPATINTTTFILKQGAAPVSGTVAYSGVTAVFTSASNLAPLTTYTATITTGARNPAGNPLAKNYSWSFTTGAAPDTTQPTVTFTDPADAATGVATNKKIAATFTEAMDPLTISTATFTLLGGGAVSGTVTYSGVTAVFTPTTNLAASTTYIGTITTGAQDLAGNALASAYVWAFTTGAAPDAIRPTVTLTVPANAAIGVSTNTKATATFSEAMDPLTINTANFTMTGPGVTPVAGTVIYVGTTATFTPTSGLAGNTTFTATITTGATDLAGNALAGNQAPLPAASDYIWTFTTGAAPDTTAPTVIATNPADLDVGDCINKTINATFSEAMDPLTITVAAFTLQASGLPLEPELVGTVVYDVLTNIATFNPTLNLATNTAYTATVKGGVSGVKDLAGNPLAVDNVTTFTTGTTTCAEPAVLGAAQPFGGFGGGAGMTNDGILTVINGDIGSTGASTLITGFHDSTGDVYTETPLNVGLVNGRIYTAPPPPVIFGPGGPFGGTAVTSAIAAAAALDAQNAYNSLMPAALPGGVDPGAGQLAGLTLAPGIYQAAGGSFQITGSDLTLDGQGDANAVWVFQMASTLLVGDPAIPRSVILINGAQAKNVFWQVGSSATINAAGGGTMVGTIISSAATSFSTVGNVTLVTLNGRALALNASVTMTNTVINVPAP